MKLFAYITSIARWVACWFVATFWILAIVLTSLVVKPRKLHKLWKFGFRMITATAGLKVTVRGLEHIDPHKGYVYMTNHVNFAEPFTDMPAVPGWVVALEKVENFKLPIYGLLIKAWGNIPIDRSNTQAALASLAYAREVLESGTSVAVMPEGTRSRDGKLGAFKKGGFHLALDAGATIVPYAHKNLHTFNRTGSILLKPTEIEIVFTPPVDTREYTKETINELMARVRGQIEAELAVPMGGPLAHPLPEPGDSQRSLTSSPLDAALKNP